MQIDADVLGHRNLEAASSAQLRASVPVCCLYSTFQSEEKHMMIGTDADVLGCNLEAASSALLRASYTAI